MGVLSLLLHEDRLLSRALRYYGELFNDVDPTAIELEQFAVNTLNVLCIMNNHGCNVIQHPAHHTCTFSVPS